MGVLHCANDVDNAAGKLARRLQLAVETRKLVGSRRRAVAEQVGRLLECPVLSQVIDAVASIKQRALAAVDGGGLGAVEVDAVEPSMDLYGVVGHCHDGALELCARPPAVEDGLHCGTSPRTRLGVIPLCLTALDSHGGQLRRGTSTENE